MKVPTILTYNHEKFPLKDHGTNIFITGRANPVMNGFKYCPKCGEDKPVGDFNKNKAKYRGLQGYCRKHDNNK